VLLKALVAWPTLAIPTTVTRIQKIATVPLCARTQRVIVVIMSGPLLHSFLRRMVSSTNYFACAMLFEIILSADDG